MQTLKLSLLVDNLVFGEAPRWHNGRLWLSDIRDQKILSVSPDGHLHVEHELDFQPSGLGWLPDGRLLVVSMDDHRLLCRNGDNFSVLADLGKYCGGRLNDMVVDAEGRAYVGNIGFDLEAKPIEPRTTVILRVDPGGEVQIAAEDVMCPNGMAITADGGTLVVAQSGLNDLLGFRITDTGALDERRVYATVPERATPDGICIDAEGAVWIASPISNEFLRVLQGGEVTHRIDTGARPAIACMLGGPDHNTLFCITAGTMSLSQAAQQRSGQIGVVNVSVPGAGWP